MVDTRKLVKCEVCIVSGARVKPRQTPSLRYVRNSDSAR